MTKRRFWRLFAAAWDKALTEQNIIKAFESRGIWYDMSTVPNIKSEANLNPVILSILTVKPTSQQP
jgi:hypothetical protein